MLTEPLKTKIIHYLNKKTNSNSWEIIYPEIHSTEAIVYRITNPNYPIDIALKAFNKDHSFKAVKQYSAFERFSIAFKAVEGKYRVPKTYGSFLEDNCFLIEWITGYSLREILWKNCLRKTTIQTHIKASNRWLKHYHQNANLKFSQVDHLRYLNAMDTHRKKLDVEELCGLNSIFIAGREILNEFSKIFSDYQALHADIHGDLSLKNILINEDYVAGIDIGANYSAPIVDDITQMLSYICINYFNMLTKTDMRKSPEFWEIFNLVLDAYQYPTQKQDRDFFLFVFLYQMLNRWISAYSYHKTNSECTVSIKLLGKWRLYNSASIVSGLTAIINKKLDSN